mmetsp:Transcript_10837/g.16553  ORF Transcript_10837/g.16553 Transcript_10837/m.16553 type:complete len:91 (-) Transcript_10837:1181-1453(-)
MMLLQRIVSLLLALLVVVNSFKFMSTRKVPKYQDPEKLKQIRDRLGDKKLMVITGASSGLGRKTAAALLRTGQYRAGFGQDGSRGRNRRL